MIFNKHLKTSSGFSLVGLVVGSVIVAIVFRAFLSFAKTASDALSRQRDRGSKNELQQYVRQMINCADLKVRHGNCKPGEILENRTISNPEIVLISGATPPLTRFNKVSLPFTMRAICTHHSEASSLISIEFKRVNRPNAKWEVLFDTVPPC